MKTLLIKIMCFAAVVFTFTACNDTMGDPDGRISEVKTLIEPSDGKTVVLDPLPAASVYFEWDYISVEEGGTAVYQITLTKQTGISPNLFMR